MSEHSYHGATSRSPSHHARTLLPQSYISLPLTKENCSTSDEHNDQSGKQRLVGEEEVTQQVAPGNLTVVPVNI